MPFEYRTAQPFEYRTNFLMYWPSIGMVAGWSSAQDKQFNTQLFEIQTSKKYVYRIQMVGIPIPTVQFGPE